MPTGELYNVEEARRRAQARLPAVLFDFVDGGADDEVTLRANRRAYEELMLRPRAAVRVEKPDLATTVFGSRIELPVILAPCGGVRLVAPDGDRAVVRAARRAGTAAIMSTAAATPLEEVANAADGCAWFQLYFHGGRQISEQLIRRAAEAGFGVLCLTVDTPVRGNHERIRRHEATLPLRPTVENAIRFGGQLALRPKWTYRYLRDGMPTNFGSLPSEDRMHHSGSPGGSWDDLEWIRKCWDGPLMVKGILDPEDGRRALDCGADGIVVSNHGGRQLDGTPATLRVLPHIRGRLGADTQILVDGGIRRGSDVVKALALGANAVMIGRPYLYGLACGGEEGVYEILTLFADEIKRTMVLLGCRRLSDLAAYVQDGIVCEV